MELSDTDNRASRNLWVCESCQKHNPLLARFCGQCGFAHDSFPLNNKQTADVSWNSRKEKFVKQILRCIETARIWRRKNKAIGAAVTFLIFAILFFALVSGISARHSMKSNVKWQEFRSYLSKRFILSSAELDSMLERTCHMIPEPEARIGINHALKMEQRMKEKFDSPELSLFPNPFFSREMLNETGTIFGDIPLDHPTYVAIKPLIELGIACEIANGDFGPYQKVAWKDWKKLNSELLAMLEVDDQFVEEIFAGRTGQMSNHELNRAMEILAERLGLEKYTKPFWAGELFFPSRLEAYSAMAQILKQLETS